MNLVVLHGVGDAYLVCALHAAYEQNHGPATIVLKSQHEAIACMFEVPYRLDDVLTLQGETNSDLWALDNPRGNTLFVHPNFVHTPTRVDQLTVSPAPTTQADAYRAIMGLPPSAPLTTPHVPDVEREPDSVLLIPAARSWPNLDVSFWNGLSIALDARGHGVVWNDPVRSLDELLAQAARSPWVIGPQCGVMSVLCEARFPCRKTFVINRNSSPPFPADAAHYGLTTKFAGNDYDVEELLV